MAAPSSTYSTANGGGRVGELERTLAACRADNGKLRTRHAEELARNQASASVLHSRDLTIARQDADLAQLRAENARLAGELTAARTARYR